MVLNCLFLTVDYGQFEFELVQPLVPSLVTRGKHCPDPILWFGFNFDGVARLFTVPGLS